jgi:hypothetical protein
MKNQNQTPKRPKFGSLSGSLPTPAEAVLIREALGIRKRRALTEDGRAQLDAARRAANSPSNPSFIEQNDRAATPPRETA